MNTIDYLIENNYCVTDKVCVYCSIITDGWNSFCPKCKDYKGMMRLPQAVETYGTDVLGY